MIDDKLPLEYPVKEMFLIYLKRFLVFFEIVFANLILFGILLLISEFSKYLPFIFSIILLIGFIYPTFFFVFGVRYKKKLKKKIKKHTKRTRNISREIYDMEFRNDLRFVRQILKCKSSNRSIYLLLLLLIIVGSIIFLILN